MNQNESQSQNLNELALAEAYANYAKLLSGRQNVALDDGLVEGGSGKEEWEIVKDVGAGQGTDSTAGMRVWSAEAFFTQARPRAMA